MTIIRRAKRPRRYSVIDNSILQDRRLSWKAQGILSFLLSLPDDWEINTKHLVNERPDGRDSTLAGLKELKELGYLKKVPIRDEKGRIIKWETQVFDEPPPGVEEESQDTGNPDSSEVLSRIRETHNVGNPECGKPVPIQSNNNTNYLNNKSLSQTLSHEQNHQDGEREKELIEFIQSRNQGAANPRAYARACLTNDRDYWESLYKLSKQPPPEARKFEDDPPEPGVEQVNPREEVLAKALGLLQMGRSPNLASYAKNKLAELIKRENIQPSELKRYLEEQGEESAQVEIVAPQEIPKFSGVDYEEESTARLQAKQWEMFTNQLAS